MHPQPLMGWILVTHQAAIAQLGERQTEDLKVPGSIPGLGMLHAGRWEGGGPTAVLRSALLRAPGQLLFVRPLVYDAATPRAEERPMCSDMLTQPRTVRRV